MARELISSLRSIRRRVVTEIFGAPRWWTSGCASEEFASRIVSDLPPVRLGFLPSFRMHVDASPDCAVHDTRRDDFRGVEDMACIDDESECRREALEVLCREYPVLDVIRKY